jgi:hypothetical protein
MGHLHGQLASRERGRPTHGARSPGCSASDQAEASCQADRTNRSDALVIGPEARGAGGGVKLTPTATGPPQNHPATTGQNVRTSANPDGARITVPHLA